MRNCSVPRSPMGMVVPVDGNLYVAESTARAIAMVDPQPRRVTGRIAFPANPTGLAIAPGGDSDRDGRPGQRPGASGRSPNRIGRGLDGSLALANGSRSSIPGEKSFTSPIGFALAFCR